jgi:hypothetical protein
MKRLLALLMVAMLPAHAAMDITREIVAPKSIVPGQPVTVAVTYWTDSWFNPPPSWPDFPVQYGVLLNTPLPNQLLSRQQNGVTWSGIRLERQMMAWDQSTLTLPAIDLNATSAGQPPATVHLDAIELPVVWPKGVEQPDRFLPARGLTLTQTITQYHAGKDKTLRAGDAVERVVTVKAQNILPAQIPQILYAIPGDESQRLTPQNTFIKGGRDEIVGAMRVEKLRYMPTDSGTLTLPPIKLRWWDTEHQQWKLAELKGETLKVESARAAGKESALRGSTGDTPWHVVIGLLILLIIGASGWFARRQLRQSANWLQHRWQRFWQPVSLPELAPVERKKR